MAIVIELTPEEHRGFKLAGDAPDDGIRDQIEIILSVGGMDAQTVEYFSARLSEAALRARDKVRAATAYEIREIE